MTYTVVRNFTDLQDDNFKYRVGDVFPHPGAKVTKARIAELMGTNNKRGMAVIAEIPTERTGSHEETLSDVQTGETASKAEKAKGKARKKA